MLRSTVSDLDSLVLLCRSKVSRSYLAEAVACAKAGAFRAAIVTTWIAVVHDINEKIHELAALNDTRAGQLSSMFRKIVETHDMAASLKWEKELLGVAQDDFEFFGALAREDLKRIYDDRNKCAHPSMLDADQDYQPSPELSRAHIVNAVTHLLQHGPVQGKAALDRIVREIDREYFPEQKQDLVERLQSGPLSHPKKILVRNVVVVLLKAYYQEPVQTQDLLLNLSLWGENAKRRKRVARMLAAVVAVQRDYAEAALHAELDKRISELPPHTLALSVSLLSHVPEAWPFLSTAQRSLFARYVEAMPRADIKETMVAAWALTPLRAAAERRMEKMGDGEWLDLSQTETPQAEWAAICLKKLLGAQSYASANAVSHFLCAFPHFLQQEDVRQLIEAANVNGELRDSFGLRNVLAALSKEPRVGVEVIVALATEAGLQEAFQRAPWWPKS